MIHGGTGRVGQIEFDYEKSDTRQRGSHSSNCSWSSPSLPFSRGCCCGFKQAKAKAVRAQCASNLKQWGIAIIMYAGDNRDFFPDNAGGSGFAWMDPN